MRIPVFLITFMLLVITPHRLPAPIHEIPESPSPTPAVVPAAELNPLPKLPPPTPVVAPTAEPKKPLPKPKSTTGTQSSGDVSLPKGAVHLVIHSDSDTRKIFTYFRYPDVSAPAGTTGLYRVEVNPDGSVAAVTILKSMGSVMDVDMMKAFVRWRAVPGPLRIVDVPRRVFEFHRVKSGPR